jgi:ParB-like chromosome segregation protein Spo0J
MTDGTLNTKKVKIDSVKPHPQNVRQGDVGAISISLEKHGQYRPIVVHKSSKQILAGNHTWKAAKAIGWKEIAVVEIDCSDEQAIQIMLADNKANDLATYNNAELVELLQSVEASIGLDGTLFDSDDLDDLIKLVNPRIPEPPVEFPEFNSEIPVDYCCPKCGYEWSGKAK